MHGGMFNWIEEIMHGEGITQGVLCRLGGGSYCACTRAVLAACLPEEEVVQRWQMCPAHWVGVGYWRGEHSRAAPHSRALCSAACSRAESPRSPACIF